MHKSISTPNLPGLGVQKGNRNIKKSVSTNALFVGELGMNVIDAIIVSKAPINQSLECLVTNEFPNHILNGDKIKIDKDMMGCLMTPSEPSESRRTPISCISNCSTFEDEFFWERYNTWLARVLRNRRAK